MVLKFLRNRLRQFFSHRTCLDNRLNVRQFNEEKSSVAEHAG
jgi:hypothetical protein